MKTFGQRLYFAKGWTTAWFFRGFVYLENRTWFWFYTLQKLFEISESTTRNPKNKFSFWQMSHNFIFVIEILSTYMTMTIILYVILVENTF